MGKISLRWQKITQAEMVHSIHKKNEITPVPNKMVDFTLFP